MPLSVTAALSVANTLLDALVRDTRALSAAVAALGSLRASPDEWTDAQHAEYRHHLDTIGELTERYRTGESILTIKRKKEQTR